MEEKDEVKFEEYDIEFSEEELENMSSEELKECKEIIDAINRDLEEE